MKETKMDIPDTGAVFTLGKSFLLADNHHSYFFVKNDPVRKLICGYKQSAVICESGRLFVWGDNKCGQLGIGITDSTIITKPTCVKFIKALGLKVQNVAFGGDFTIVLTECSKVFYCGKNIFPFNSKIESLEAKFIKSSANFEYSIVPLELNEIQTILAPGEAIQDIQAGVEHFVVLTDHQKLWGWGVNTNLALGYVDVHKILATPVPFKVTDNIVAVRCGPYSTIAVTDRSTLLIFGSIKGNILLRPHEIALTSNITSLDVSLTDEIFLITDKGKLLRSNQFKKIDDVSIEFVDFLKAEDEKIQQIVCGDSFVGILTESGRLYTNLSEEDGHSIDELQELNKFKSMVVSQCEAGKEHMLLHVKHLTEQVSGAIPLVTDVVAVGQRLMPADTKVRNPSIDAGLSIDSEVLKSESIDDGSSPLSDDTIGEQMANDLEDGKCEDLTKATTPVAVKFPTPPMKSPSPTVLTPVEQLVSESIAAEMPESPKHKFNETFIIPSPVATQAVLPKDKKHMLEKISSHKRLDYPESDSELPYCETKTAYEKHVEQAEKAEREAMEKEPSPSPQKNNVPFYQRKINCEDTALYLADNKTPTIEDDTSESMLHHLGSEATTMDVDSRTMSNTNTPEIITTTSPRAKRELTEGLKSIAHEEEHLDDIEIPEIPSKLSTKEEASGMDNTIRYINDGVDVTEAVDQTVVAKRVKEITPLRPELERSFLGDELTEKNAPPQVKNLKSQTEEFLKHVTLDDCRGQEEETAGKKSLKSIRMKTPIPTIKKIDEFSDTDTMSSQSTFNDSDYIAEESTPPKKPPPRKKLGFVRQFFEDLKNVPKELSCKNTDTVVPEAQTRHAQRTKAGQQ